MSLSNKHLTSQQQTSEMVYGFEESAATRRLDLTNHKTSKRTFFVKKGIFGFVDHEKITCGLGYKLKLKHINYNDPGIRAAGVDAAR